jgi:hypothetical protein
MRYYSITIQDPKTGQVVTPPGFTGLLGGATYTSYINGQTLPGAWNVELDIPVIDAATSQGFGLIRVWGISLQEIGQANNLNGKNIKIYGGMQKGLPLANPAQAGLLVSGTIFQAFGNWVGVDMTLDLVIMPGPAGTASNPGGIGTLKAPKNIVLNWKAGTPLGQALQNALQTAYPGANVSVNINSSIVSPGDQIGYYPTLEQLAQYVRQASKDIVKTANYAGVSIVPLPNGGFSAFDGSAAPSGTPKMIAFQDLIGQPTWLEAPNISIKTMMRADLSVGQQITLPPTLTINTQAAASSLVNQKAAFQGGFTIISLRHVGNFRQSTADAWVTVIEGAPNVVTGTSP